VLVNLVLNRGSIDRGDTLLSTAANSAHLGYGRGRWLEKPLPRSWLTLSILITLTVGLLAYSLHYDRPSLGGGRARQQDWRILDPACPHVGLRLSPVVLLSRDEQNIWRAWLGLPSVTPEPEATARIPRYCPTLTSIR
jgi:hypothetical protein